MINIIHVFIFQLRRMEDSGPNAKHPRAVPAVEKPGLFQGWVIDIGPQSTGDSCLGGENYSVDTYEKPVESCQG